jgi:nicotinate-nucleotide adenylyltransferase
MPQPLAILGLTANPPHQGHLAISRVLRALGYPQVWWSIAPEQEFKPAGTLIPYAHRLELARILTAPHPWLTLDPTEATLAVRNEHFRTLELFRALAAAHAGYAFTFVLGGDSWADPTKGFHTWGGFEQIIDYAGLLIIPRPDHVTALLNCPAAQTLQSHRFTGQGPVPKGHWALYPQPVAPFSSTAIRAALAQNQPTQGLTPEQLAYIRAHHLYRSTVTG